MINMVFQSNGTRWKKILRNAAVLGGISAVANLTTAGGFSLDTIWTGLLTGLLVALVEIKHAYNIFPSIKQNKKAQKSFFLT